VAFTQEGNGLEAIFEFIILILAKEELNECLMDKSCAKA
jgi:hypothetical protein